MLLSPARAGNRKILLSAYAVRKYQKRMTYLVFVHEKLGNNQFSQILKYHYNSMYQQFKDYI